MGSEELSGFAVLVRERLRLRDDGETPGRRLAGALRDLAEVGALAPGARLPSERDLARIAGLSRGTAASALNLLCAEGLCERRQGSGTYLREDAAPPPASLPGLLRAGAVLADLSASVVPDPSHLVLPRIDAAALLRTPSGHGYDALGEPRLRALLGGDVLVTGGGQQGIDLAARVLLRPGDRVLTGDPTYGGALAAFRRAGAHAVAADLTDPGAVRAAVELHRPALVYTLAVGNPTGAAPDLRHVAEIARDADLPILEDRVLAELVYDGEPPAPLARTHPHGTVTVGSLSKVLWGGLRVGWLAASEPLLARLAEAKLDADLATGAVSQRMAAELLERNSPGPWRAELARRRDHLAGALAAALPEWSFDVPRGGLSLWVRLPGADTDRFAAHARRHGVGVAPGSLFSPDGRHRDRLRLSFAPPPALLDQAVAALAEAWRTRP
ncbi:PLP-dependent aminotransferase family protein [Bailinhaonella thermotolerans]|uniref:aminotransferase-like domain-containing protein n=1 Tax=Bailinhaonella thermotolerans TaxID=1070861 RepID=UPI001F5BA48F|nr:PLP-dependent aminotransferase family protein [Bailinhaonella thermotolerans]